MSNRRKYCAPVCFELKNDFTKQNLESLNHNSRARGSASKCEYVRMIVG
jgi:hypothetical protein